jgi:hypothetical protein
MPMFEVVASAGTTIFNWVSLTTVNFASWALPIHTALVPVKPLPVAVITVPTGPLVGEKLLNVCCL